MSQPHLPDTVLEHLFARSPFWGRVVGDHDLDGVLPDRSAAAEARWAATAHDLLRQLDDAPAGGSPGEVAELDTARLALRSDLLDIERLKVAERDPTVVLDEVATVDTYLDSPYAPLDDRVAALIRHLRQLPEVLDGGLARLDSEVLMGPRLVAIDSARGFSTFFRNDLLTAAEGSSLLGELRDIAGAAAQACDRYSDALQTRGALRESALGVELFLTMLREREGVDETAEHLRAQAEAELDRLEGLAAATSQRLGFPDARSAFAASEREQPTADSLIADTTAIVAKLQEFWRGRDAIRIPAGPACVVEPTPAYRAWSSASYAHPGSWTPNSFVHRYFITTVQPTWNPREAAEWLEYMNVSALQNVSVHEIFPGHYVQQLHNLEQPSRLLRSVWLQGFGEGWAHYSEQLAQEQGISELNPMIELAQLRDALLRACRMRAALGLHTEGMSLEDANELFERRAVMGHLPAAREAMRGTHDPMYMLYCYGKLEILRWRELAQSRPGYNLRDFHDHVLGFGTPPLAVLRRAVTGEQDRTPAAVS